MRTKSFQNTNCLVLRPLSDDNAKLHALFNNTPEYDATFQSAGLAGSTVL